MPSKDTTTITKGTSAILRKATEQLRNLFEESGQPIYLYLDDHNKACNENFAQLLGYASPEAWAAVQTSFPQAFVAPSSQQELVGAFQSAMEGGIAANVPVTWKRKDGKSVTSDVILVPFEVDGARMALHFITS
jgi:PAS domain S-box-containing protein